MPACLLCLLSNCACCNYQMHLLPRLDPCWLAEGSADYHAYHESFNFPSLKGFRPGMHDALYNIQQMLVKAPQVRLQMMGDSNNMPPKVQQYYNELAYVRRRGMGCRLHDTPPQPCHF